MYQVEYLEKIKDDKDLLAFEVKKSFGYVLEAMKNVEIYPELNLLLSFETALTIPFIVENYNLNKKEQKRVFELTASYSETSKRCVEYLTKKIDLNLDLKDFDKQVKELYFEKDVSLIVDTPEQVAEIILSQKEFPLNGVYSFSFIKQVVEIIGRDERLKDFKSINKFYTKFIEYALNQNLLKDNGLIPKDVFKTLNDFHINQFVSLEEKISENPNFIKSAFNYMRKEKDFSLLIKNQLLKVKNVDLVFSELEKIFHSNDFKPSELATIMGYIIAEQEDIFIKDTAASKYLNSLSKEQRDKLFNGLFPLDWNENNVLPGRIEREMILEGLISTLSGENFNDEGVKLLIYPQIKKLFNEDEFISDVYKRVKDFYLNKPILRSTLYYGIGESPKIFDALAFLRIKLVEYTFKKNISLFDGGEFSKAGLFPVFEFLCNQNDDINQKDASVEENNGKALVDLMSNDFFWRPEVIADSLSLKYETISKNSPFNSFLKEELKGSTPDKVFLTFQSDFFKLDEYFKDKLPGVNDNPEKSLLKEFVIEKLNNLSKKDAYFCALSLDYKDLGLDLNAVGNENIKDAVVENSFYRRESFYYQMDYKFVMPFITEIFNNEFAIKELQKEGIYFSPKLLFILSIGNMNIKNVDFFNSSSDYLMKNLKRFKTNEDLEYLLKFPEISKVLIKNNENSYSLILSVFKNLQNRYSKLLDSIDTGEENIKDQIQSLKKEAKMTFYSFSFEDRKNFMKEVISSGDLFSHIKSFEDNIFLIPDDDDFNHSSWVKKLLIFNPKSTLEFYFKEEGFFLKYMVNKVWSTKEILSRDSIDALIKIGGDNLRNLGFNSLSDENKQSLKSYLQNENPLFIFSSLFWHVKSVLSNSEFLNLLEKAIDNLTAEKFIELSSIIGIETIDNNVKKVAYSQTEDFNLPCLVEMIRSKPVEKQFLALTLMEYSIGGYIRNVASTNKSNGEFLIGLLKDFFSNSNQYDEIKSELNFDSFSPEDSSIIFALGNRFDKPQFKDDLNNLKSKILSEVLLKNNMPIRKLMETFNQTFNQKQLTVKIKSPEYKYYLYDFCSLKDFDYDGFLSNIDLNIVRNLFENRLKESNNLSDIVFLIDYFPTSQNAFNDFVSLPLTTLGNRGFEKAIENKLIDFIKSGNLSDEQFNFLITSHNNLKFNLLNGACDNKGVEFRKNYEFFLSDDFVSVLSKAWLKRKVDKSLSKIILVQENDSGFKM